VNQHVGEQQRPLGELFSELVHETTSIVKNEIVLAKTEMTAKATSAAKDAAMIGVGGAVALLGAIALLAAVIAGLSMVMPVWLAALIVGGVLCAIGGALTMGGLKKLQHLDPVPRQTVETLEENKRWLREQVSR
jgi:hypothetical protein